MSMTMMMIAFRMTAIQEIGVYDEITNSINNHVSRRDSSNTTGWLFHINGAIPMIEFPKKRFTKLE